MLTPQFYDLGTIKPGSINEVEFSFGADVSYVTQIETPCTCTNAGIDNKKRVLKVTYIPSPIPVQLSQQGQYESTKVIKIEYKLRDEYGGGKITQNLVINAIVKN